jgi:hypothetical protein
VVELHHSGGDLEEGLAFASGLLRKPMPSPEGGTGRAGKKPLGNYTPRTDLILRGMRRILERLCRRLRAKDDHETDSWSGWALVPIRRRPYDQPLSVEYIRVLPDVDEMPMAETQVPLTPQAIRRG